MVSIPNRGQWLLLLLQSMGSWCLTVHSQHFSFVFLFGFYFAVVRILALFLLLFGFLKLLPPLLHSSVFWYRTATHQLFTIPSPLLFFSTTLPRHRLKGHFIPCRRLPMPTYLIKILLSLFPTLEKN